MNSLSQVGYLLVGLVVTFTIPLSLVWLAGKWADAADRKNNKKQ